MRGTYKEEIHGKDFFWQENCEHFFWQEDFGVEFLKTSSAVKGDIDFFPIEKTTINHLFCTKQKFSNGRQTPYAGVAHVLCFDGFFVLCTWWKLMIYFLELAQYLVIHWFLLSIPTNLPIYCSILKPNLVLGCFARFWNFRITVCHFLKYSKLFVVPLPESHNYLNRIYQNCKQKFEKKLF